MEIIIEDLFIEQLQKCPQPFQEKFRKAYQQLRVVDKPLEIKNIVADTHTKNFYKLIEESKIGLQIKGSKLHILCFLRNQCFET